jgi:hypothetical protein
MEWRVSRSEASAVDSSALPLKIVRFDSRAENT